VFLVLAVLIGLAAVRSQAPLMFILFGGMMGSLHISAILARRMLSAVSVRTEAPSRLWQHQAVHIGYFLRNGRRRTPCLALGLKQPVSGGMESTGGGCAELAGGGSFRAAARLVGTRRGRFSLAGVRLNTLFPFGLIEATKQFKDESALVVWPARGKLKKRLLRHGAAESWSAAPSRASGGQDEFFGLREYRDGDNPRWIHWRRSAGRSAPVMREMSSPPPEILWVILDTYQSDLSAAACGRKERMIRFAATLIDHAFFRQYKVGLAMACSGGIRVFPASAGRGQRRELLDALAEADTNTNWRLGEMARMFRPGQLAQSQVVVLTDSANGNKKDALLHMRPFSRHVRVIASDALNEFFDDSPMAAGEAAECL
jgi:uncharacterized protein (DUF58 family)